jgi:tocopherol cyclase
MQNKDLLIFKHFFRGFVFSVIGFLILPFLHLFYLPQVVDHSVAHTLDFLDSIQDKIISQSSITKFCKETLGWHIFHPEGYHTKVASRLLQTGYFEGWYYKIGQPGAQNNKNNNIIIPGIIYSKTTEPFAFIMFGDPSNEDKNARYGLHKFDVNEFHAYNDGSEEWSIKIGPNTFSANSVTLALNSTSQSVHGTIALSNSVPFPSSLLLPDIMGVFAFINQECKHGVVSLSSDISGSFTIGSANKNNKKVWNKGNSVVYVEKDWGSSFPRTWVWIQTNNLMQLQTQHNSRVPVAVAGTLLFSVASIPFPSDKIELIRFRGFLCALWLPNSGGLYRFATYTGAVIESIQINSEKSGVTLSIKSAQYRLKIKASGTREDALTLHGPIPGGDFKPFVREMLDASIDIELIRRSDDSTIWKGHGDLGGLEIESMEKGMQLLETKN